jgi:peroxiredoxin
MHSPIPAKKLVVVIACLCTGASAAAQPASRNEWLLMPQLVRGQEFSYSGWVTEEFINDGVRCPRSYRLESSFLVLDSSKTKWDVAFLTVLSRQEQRAGQQPVASASAPSSARLELVEIDTLGHVRGKPGVTTVPLDGPPTAEFGAIVEVPRSAVSPEQFWDVAEEGRSPRTWRVAGAEVVQSALCVKLVGTQQSQDWDQPRGDHTAWQRRDTVWLAPQVGVAYRVERVIERRAPLRTEPTYRAVVRYERDNQATYLGQLFDDCVAEIERARKFQEEAEPLLREPDLYRGQLDGLLKRIALHLQKPPTVGQYRKAMVQIQRRLEAARNHLSTPELGTAAVEAGPQRIVLGQRVPDFVVTELVEHESVRLYRLKGHPVLLMFYNPSTDIGRQVLRFAQALSEKHRPSLTVLALAVTEDEELVKSQHAEMHLTFPILDGKGLHPTYGVDGLPRFVLLDSDGVLRASWTGWGAHTAHEVAQEVERWLPR